MPEHEQLGIFRPVAAECKDSHAEYPARQQVDDLEQHLAKPTITASIMLATVQVTHPIEYSSGTGPALA
jgi:hypothetical protein